MDGRPNRRNKAAFSNFSSLVWKGPEYTASGCHLAFILSGSFCVLGNFGIFMVLCFGNGITNFFSIDEILALDFKL